MTRTPFRTLFAVKTALSEIYVLNQANWFVQILDWTLERLFFSNWIMRKRRLRTNDPQKEKSPSGGNRTGGRCAEGGIYLFVVRVHEATSGKLVETVAQRFSTYKLAQKFIDSVMTTSFSKKYVCFIGTE